ncbi:MAG: type II toxin-antitoxin system PemK/MazF family toxin [Cytophagaceae bacterium]|nr:MAG: type II toxin-antitoxin system PemK/MazF family toxin [Cytophagaceae bacterium]
MTINKRDIVEIAFYTGNKPEPHPAVVVSNDEIFEAEGFFYAVLLSTKNHFPDFTIEITPDMINSPRNNRNGYAICHMIQQFYTEDVISRTGATLKADAFKKLTNKVKEVIFG